MADAVTNSRPSSQHANCWEDGRAFFSAPSAEPLCSAEDLDAGLACYSTARIRDGAPVWARRHALRLKRDAAALFIGTVDPTRVELALSELARACFDRREGIIRVAAVRRTGNEPRIVAEARELVREPEHWNAVQAPFPHHIQGAWTGAKGSNHALYVRARSLMSQAGVEEVVLVDSAGYVIEGCRSNFFVVDREGALVAPNISRGAVAGLAQQIVHELIPSVVIRDLSVDELDDARELVAVNAVRQAVSIVRLDQKPIGTGQPGEWQQRLSHALASIS